MLFTHRSCSPILLHFPRVPSRIVGQVTFNTERQRYESVDSPGTLIDLTYVIYHENHSKCYFFTDMSGLKLAPFLLFLLVQNVVGKDMHLHSPKNKVEISENENINSGINTPNIESVNERKYIYCSK